MTSSARPPTILATFSRDWLIMALALAPGDKHIIKVGLLFFSSIQQCWLLRRKNGPRHVQKLIETQTFIFTFLLPNAHTQMITCDVVAAGVSPRVLQGLRNGLDHFRLQRGGSVVVHVDPTSHQVHRQNVSTRNSVHHAHTQTQCLQGIPTR